MPQRRQYDYTRIRAAREGRFTTTQVASLLGITKRSVENHESGLYVPRADQLADYAALTGRPINYFYPVV